MNNSTSITNEDDPTAALLKCLQAQLTHSTEPSSNETEHRTSVTVAKYEDLSKKMIDMSNPFYSKTQNSKASSEFRKKIQFFEESLNPKKNQDNDRRKFPLLKKTSIKEKDVKYQKTKFKNNTILQEAFTSIIKEVANEIKFNCNSLKIQDDDNDLNSNFSLFSNSKQFNQDSNIVVYKAWNILIENKKFYELESDTNNHTIITNKTDDYKGYTISSSQTNFISTMQTFSFNLDTSKLKQKKEKPKLKFDIFLKQNSIVSNGQNESPLFTEESEDIKSSIINEMNSLQISPKKHNKKNSSCSVRSVRNVKKYEDIKLNSTSGKKGHRNTSCDNLINNNIKSYTNNFAKKNNSEIILYLYDVYAKIEKGIKNITKEDTKKLLFRLKTKIQNVILQIKNNEKKGKYGVISEDKKDERESKENGKANLCLRSHLIMLRIFEIPKKIMYGDNEESCAINDVEYLTKIKREEKIFISDFNINTVKSFFETLLMKLKLVNIKGANIKYKKV